MPIGFEIPSEMNVPSRHLDCLNEWTECDQFGSGRFVGLKLPLTRTLLSALGGDAMSNTQDKKVGSTTTTDGTRTKHSLSTAVKDPLNSSVPLEVKSRSKEQDMDDTRL